MSEYYRGKEIAYSAARIVAAMLVVQLAMSTNEQSSTVEGTVGESCIPSSATYTLTDGDKLYLGDLSSNDRIFHGTRDDWAYLENRDGLIHTDQESGVGSQDEGVFTDIEGGFTYEEDGANYTVRFEEEPRADIPVSIETDCNLGEGQ